MKQITFITGNQGKWEIAQNIFLEYDIDLLHDKMETPEIQSLDVVEVARFSASYALQKSRVPILTSDVGYYFNALNGFPGPFVKYVNQTLQPDDILRLMHGVQDRSVIIKECLAFAVAGQPVFTCLSEQAALIAHQAEGEGSTIDKLLLLQGFDKPKGVYSPEEIFDHWKSTLPAYHQMAKHIKSTA